MEIKRVGTFRCQLGEGPVWDVDEQALYFIDATACAIWRYDPASDEFNHWKTPAQIGSLALRKNGGAVVALASGFHLFDFNTGIATFVSDPESTERRTKFNDGKVDRQGRFVAGTVDIMIKEPLGSIYRLDPDMTVATLDRGFRVSNGPCWSPDGRTLYCADSVLDTIFAYDYDPDRGSASNRRVFAETSALGGVPDGATVDAEGRYWVAICRGGKIACYRPDGAIEQVIEVPAPLVSSVMFGGPNLDRLFFTSIDGAIFSSIGDASGKPVLGDSGGLYVIDGLGVKGLPETRFAG